MRGSAYRVGGGLEERTEVGSRLENVRQPYEVGHVWGERLDVRGSEMDFGGVSLEMSL